MTTPPNGPTPDDDESPAPRSSEPGRAAGVELGKSDDGGTFEPEEDAQPDG
ncbi:hypothetical protein OF117_15500 [Geodermatophilus sp. YIM 151500]|uniref:hypothetical protein n=1 Tax=Geodermatophilus sp. YIM 151500 TaxID=2984531 RepID=UPI0021E4103E|nr:hypothetical protein [Geodermatophilus sp. YIM 151500]MCV2490765.1 hypothetical protein [Geodermatophilus sp. YIM 151500]